MPNWNINNLEVSGPPTELEKFKEFVTGPGKNNNDEDVDHEFDFNKVIPYPDKYGDVDKLARVNEKKREAECKKYGKKLTQKQRDAVFEKYPSITDGYNSGGYEWCINNWGTKWNACEVSVQGKPKDGVLYYGFDTAWSPPEPIIKKLGTLFPKLTLALTFSEPGVGFEGELVMKHGKVSVEECHDMPVYKCKKCGTEQMIETGDDEATCWKCGDTGDWELVK